VVSTWEIAHLHAIAQMCAMRRHAHGFLAARDHDVGIAVEDRLIAERDGAQTRAAQLIDAPGRALDRDAGTNRGLPRRILALTRRQDLAHDDFGDLRPFDARALERFRDRNLAKLVRRQIGEDAVEGADRRTRCTDDDDIVLHGKAPCLLAFS
jgi:hypothetical protein